MKTYFYIITACCIIIPSLIAAADKEDMVRERIYLQTDKQVYLAGELMWMKILTTDEDGVPLDLSKVAYVELLDESNALVQLKLELANGVGEGWMVLPTTLPSASYRIVAYTRYMRNEGENIYFSKIVPVINTLTTDQTVNLAANADVPFLVISKENELATDLSSIGGVEVSIDKETYGVRSVGELTISDLPTAIHSLSVAIYRNDGAYTRLCSINEWYKRLNTHAKIPFSGTIIPEYEGHILEGKIVDIATDTQIRRNDIIPLLSFLGDQVRFFTGMLDENGNVIFNTKRIDGTQEIATTIVSFRDDRCRVDIASPFVLHTKKTLPELAVNIAQEEKLAQRNISLQALYTYMSDSLSKYEKENALFQWKPTKEYLLDDYTRFPTMSEVFIEFIPQARFRKVNDKRYLNVYSGGAMGTFSSANTLVLVDGIPIINHENIYTYDPSLVEKIDIYQNKYFFGKQMVFDGIVSFKTYKNDYPGLRVDEITQIFDYEGTQNKRFFYVPSYRAEDEKRSRIPDFRHTLLWNPNIDTKGESSVTIPFTTSDLTGDFIAIVEGITKDGQVISSAKLIKVE